MNAQDTITTHNFIADYVAPTGQHFNQCFQMMDLLTTDESKAAHNLNKHLSNNGMSVYCLMCTREKLTAEELQHIADSGDLPDVKQGYIGLYPSKQCLKDIQLLSNHRYLNYPADLM